MRPASAELHPVSAPAAVDLAEHPASIASTPQATSPEHPLRWWLPVWLVLAGVGVFVACFGIVGADCYWLVAMGRWIIAHGRIPDGVPFAAAPTSGWPNPLVLAELLFTAFAAVGPQGLLAAQVLADLGAMLLLAVGARREGAGGGRTAMVLALVFVGSLAPLVVIRLQLLSLIPFGALLLLLRSEHERPSWRIWLLVPLCALWSNLHGAVLMGLAVAGCYLLFSRLPVQPGRAVLVGLTSVAALFVTPALWRTGHYYVGVFNNQAAQSRTGFWAPPNFANVLDVLMMGAGCVLLVRMLKHRRPLWEYLALAGLAAATATSARHGLWLLFLMVAPAAAQGRCWPPRCTHALHERRRVAAQDQSAHKHRRWPASLVMSTLVAVTAVTAVGLRNASSITGHPVDLIQHVKFIARGHVVLAQEPLAEELAANGVPLLTSNPIDAFERQDQRHYLSFLDGSGRGWGAERRPGIVVIRSDGPATVVASFPSDFRLISRVGDWLIYGPECSSMSKSPSFARPAPINSFSHLVSRPKRAAPSKVTGNKTFGRCGESSATTSWP